MKSAPLSPDRPLPWRIEVQLWLRRYFPTPGFVALGCGVCNLIFLQASFLYSLIGIYLFGYALAQLIPVMPKRAKSVVKTSMSGLFTSLSLLVLAPLQPSFAQAAGASCSATQGVFGGLTDFFIQAFSAAGSSASADDVCFIFGIVAAILAVVFIITVGIAAYQVNNGGELRVAFIPVGLVLFLTVAAGLITRLLLGTTP